MRLGLLLVVAIACGAIAGVLMPSSYLDEAASAGRTVGDAATTVFYDPSELNPLRWIFDWEKKQIETNANRDTFAIGKPVTLRPFSAATMSSKLRLDNRAVDPGSISGGDPR